MFEGDSTKLSLRKALSALIGGRKAQNGMGKDEKWGFDVRPKLARA